MSYYEKYLKYKNKYFNLKNQAGGIINIDTNSNYYYINSNKTTALSDNCRNQTFHDKKYNEYRFLLLDINEFIKTCNTIEYNERAFIDNINASNADIGLLLNIIPKLNYNNSLRDITIFNHKILASNDINRFLASGIYSSLVES
jgi:protein associated with RNAse G/E